MSGCHGPVIRMVTTITGAALRAGTKRTHDDHDDVATVLPVLLQLISQDQVQRELTALDKRLRGLTDQQRPAIEAENLRLHLTLLQQAQFLPDDLNVGQAVRPVQSIGT